MQSLRELFSRIFSPRLRAEQPQQEAPLLSPLASTHSSAAPSSSPYDLQRIFELPTFSIYDPFDEESRQLLRDAVSLSQTVPNPYAQADCTSLSFSPPASACWSSFATASPQATRRQHAYNCPGGERCEERNCPCRECLEPDCERLFGHFAFLHKLTRPMGEGSYDSSTSFLGRIVSGLDAARNALATGASAFFRNTVLSKLLNLKITKRTWCWRCGDCFCEEHLTQYATLVLAAEDAFKVGVRIEALRIEFASAGLGEYVYLDLRQTGVQEESDEAQQRPRLPSAEEALNRCLEAHEQAASLCQYLARLLPFPCFEPTTIGTGTGTDLEAQTSDFLDISPGTFIYFEPPQSRSTSSASSTSDTASCSSATTSSSSINSAAPANPVCSTLPALSLYLQPLGKATLVLDGSRRLIVLPDGRMLVREKVCKHCDRFVRSAKAREMAWRERQREMEKRERWERERESRARGSPQREAGDNSTSARQSEACDATVTEEEIMQALQAAAKVISRSQSSSSKWKSSEPGARCPGERAQRPLLSYGQDGSSGARRGFGSASGSGSGSRSSTQGHIMTSIDITDSHAAERNSCRSPVAGNRKRDNSGPARPDPSGELGQRTSHL